jgi:hypothetical protein
MTRVSFFCPALTHEDHDEALVHRSIMREADGDAAPGPNDSVLDITVTCPECGEQSVVRVPASSV